MDSNLFWFNAEQWEKIAPHLPKHQPGPQRDDDHRILSGLMHVLRIGCRWKDCPKEKPIRALLGSSILSRLSFGAADCTQALAHVRKSCSAFSIFRHWIYPMSHEEMLQLLEFERFLMRSRDSTCRASALIRLEAFTLGSI